MTQLTPVVGSSLDLDRCRRGMAELQIEGRARPALIEDAITAIRTDRVEALRERYFGIKNYANFGDQREDHQYGWAPKHGSIVFRIARTDKAREPGYALSDDALYYLEAYRDVEALPWTTDEQRTVYLNLSEAIRLFDQITRQHAALATWFETSRVDLHV